MTRNKIKKIKKNPKFQEIYGFHSVMAALQNPKRVHCCIFILEKYKNFLKKYSSIIPKIITLSNKEMSKLIDNESLTHGIVLKSYKIIGKNFNDILFESKNKTNSIIIVLDQVTDPQNIGSIMRSCALFNCETIIVSKNHSPDITVSMSKAASGALEIINYVKIVNL